MAPPEPDSTFPGTLCAGDGVRLAGAGPDMLALQMDAGLPFKALIHGGPTAPDDESGSL